MMKTSWACTKELLHLACSSPYKDFEHYGTFTASSQHVSNMYVYTSSTRTRRGGSCLRVILEVFYLQNLHPPCAGQAPARVLCANLLHCCCPRTGPARGPGAMQRQANTFFTGHTSHCTLHTPHSTLHTCTSHSTVHLNSSHLSSSHLISSLLICLKRRRMKPFSRMTTTTVFHTNFDTQQAFTHSKLYTETLLHRKLLNRKLLHRDARRISCN